MPALYGSILTFDESVYDYIATYRQHNFSAAKVVTGWGLPHSWQDHERAALLQAVPRLIVRSTAGDPSNYNTAWFPHPDLVVEEFRPWVALRPDIWLEVGNEPDVVWDNSDALQGAVGREWLVWEYRYWLEQAEIALRRAFPRAKLIAPSPRVNHHHDWRRWIDVSADVLARFDTLSAHIYGWHQLPLAPGQDTGQFAAIKAVYDELFPFRSVAVTELGIHDVYQTPQQKLAAYRKFARSLPENWRWALVYHHNRRRDIHPEYSVLP